MDEPIVLNSITERVIFTGSVAPEREGELERRADAEAQRPQTVAEREGAYEKAAKTWWS